MSLLDSVLQTLNSLKIDGSSAEVGGLVESENIDTAEKLRVFSSLPTITANLGPTDSREKLIPTIATLVTKAIDAGDDEVLVTIAQKLACCADFLGGKEYVVCLVPILEQIVCGVEEVVVAEAACDALVEIAPKLPTEAVEEKLVGMIRRILEAEDLYCASRKVASKLITVCYPLVSAKLQTDLKYRIIHLADSDDEVPLVRAAAVHQLVDLAKLIGSEFKPELCLILTNLVADHQRVVRAACVAPLIELGRMVTDPNEFDSSVRPCIDKLANDGVRDIRRAMANHITELQQVACSFGNSSRSLHSIMQGLLEDNEVETRRVATTKFKGFCLATPKDILSTILLPQIREHMFMEREEPVRAELVRCAVSLLTSISREEALPLVQHILAFLNDTSSQSKQYVFEHFGDLVNLIPATDIQLTLLPSLLRLWQDKNWRVRLGVIQSVPCLYTHLPEACARETVLPANLAWLRDPSWYVRECACRSLARLLSTFNNLIKEALDGLSPKDTTTPSVSTSGAAASNLTSPTSPPAAVVSSGSQPNSPTTTTTATGTPTTTSPISAISQLTAATTLVAAAGGAGDSTLNSSTSSNTTSNFVNAVTAQAAAGGLKALATDTNYHLRQVYLMAVQTLWGPGIPDESPYSATEDCRGMGIVLSGMKNAYLAVSNRKTASSVPANCQPPPQLSTGHLSACVTQILRLASEDAVPNVRICACQALYLISNSLDKKLIQKSIIPVLRKITESDSDDDVRYFAHETQSIMAAI